MVFGDVMGAVELIKQSQWWREAQEMPDRHYEESAGVSLADHLESVHANLRLLLSPDGLDGYFVQVRQALPNAGSSRFSFFSVLTQSP